MDSTLNRIAQSDILRISAWKRGEWQSDSFSFAIPAADHSATAYKTSCLYFLYIPVRTDTNVKRISSVSMIHVGLGFVLAKLHSLKGESSIYQFIASASMGVMKSSNRNSRSGVAVTKNRCFTLCPTIMHRLAATPPQKNSITHQMIACSQGWV